MLNDKSNQEIDTFEIEELPFVKHKVVRLMRMNLDSDKMIRERVKVGMNRFLYDVLKDVCEDMNKFPYTTIEYEMFEKSIYPYYNIKKINQEKMEILAHLEAIKAECDVLSTYIKRTLKLDALEALDREEEFIPFTGRTRAIKKMNEVKSNDYFY